MDNSEDRYTGFSMALHWMMATIVFCLFMIGWNMVDLPRGSERTFYFALHKSLGLTVLTLAFVRVIWRLYHRPPPYHSSIPGWRISIARCVHYFLYILMFLQPLSGYLSSSFSGYSTRVFGLPLPQWGWRDPPVNEFFTEIHVASSVLLLTLIGIHILGALSHAFAREDGVFRRIFPW